MKINNGDYIDSREFTEEECEKFCKLAVEQEHGRGEWMVYHNFLSLPLLGVRGGELHWSGGEFSDWKKTTTEFRKWLDEGADKENENPEKTLFRKVQRAVNEFERSTNVKIKSLDLKHTKAIGERGVSSVMINRAKEEPELPEDFTRHTGGTMPEGLHPKDEVRVVLMGVPHEPFIGLAGSCGWAQAGDSTIIGYKVTKKHVAAATQPDPSYPTDLSEITPLQAANAVMYNGKQVRLTQDEAAKMLVYLIELRGGCTGSGE